MNAQQIAMANAIDVFTTDLSNSCTDEDRMYSVRFLARRIGIDKANQVAELFGLTRDYFKANAQTLNN